MPSPDAFPLQLPDTKDGQATVLSRLRVWRKYRIDRLKSVRLGNQLTFDYDRRLDQRFYHSVLPYDPDYPPCRRALNVCSHFSWPTRRELPAIFREGACRYIRITKALQVGLDLNAQVFAGVLGAPDDPTATPVTLKIYRPSQMDRETWKILKEDPPVFGDHIAVGIQSFKREFWAYTEMASLQGIVVPHVYGFFEVELPDNEKCVALVMEYIENIDHEEYVCSVGPLDANAMAALGNGLALAMHAVHICGVAPLDFEARNVLLPRAYPTFPVLIDFGDVGAIEEFGENIYAIEIMRVLSQVGFDRAKAIEWEIAQEADPAWIDMFCIPSVSAGTPEEER